MTSIATPPSENTPLSSDKSGNGLGLSTVELRVLGVLIEKSFVTPDNYPLSLNAIITGCNQSTGRDPVMRLNETAAQQALDTLQARALVAQRDRASGRVAKYEHLIRLRYSLPRSEQAVLALLLLRGAQTLGEIRQRAERMHHFENLQAVEVSLGHLIDKYPPMAGLLPKAPGTKEARYVHLLGKASDMVVHEIDSQPDEHVSPLPVICNEVAEEIQRLRDELAELRCEFERFRSSLSD